MAAPDPAHDALSTEKAQDERYVAALCRNARLRNKEIHKKREQLRKEIRDIQDQSYAIESQYWHEYHERLAHIGDAYQKWSTRKWISAFGDNEKHLSEAVAKRQAKLREEARLKQEELAVLDGEFWGAWSRHMDVMRVLSPLPPSSGSTPAATVPVAAPQPADSQESGASPATHSNGSRSHGESIMHSTNGQEQRASGTSSAASQSLPKISPAALKAANAQGQRPSQPSQGLPDDAMQPAKGASPFAAPTPISRAPSPNLSTPASASKQRRRLRSSTTAASPEQQHDGCNTPSSSPTPRSLTPKSAFTGVESSPESSRETAGIAQSTRPQMAAAAESPSQKTSAAVDPVQPTPPKLSKLTIPKIQDDNFIGVTNPEVGEIYQAFYKDAHYEGWWMCTVLPWDAWERQIGINYSFHQAGLFNDLPDHCYTVDRVPVKPKSRRRKPVITGWKRGFEADGPRARERVFPVLFFDDTPGDPGNYKFPASPQKPFSFPKQALRALPAEWVAAASLRLPGVDVGRPVAGRDTAERFRERVRARRTLQAKKKPGTPSTPRTPETPATGSTGPVEVSSAVDASSAVEGGFAMQDTTREDTEMADAESLSGATAVEDTAGQLDVLEADPTVKTTPSGSAKRWRAVILGQDA